MQVVYRDTSEQVPKKAEQTVDPDDSLHNSLVRPDMP